MKRGYLIAFVLGIIAALTSVVAGSYLGAEPEAETTPYLTVFAPDILLAEGKSETEDNIAFLAGEAIRNCGLDDFSMRLGDIHGIHYEIEISKENIRGLHCVEDSVREVDDEVSLGFKVQ